MNKTLFKTIAREIFSTFSRFVSILAIIMIGVGFFTGLFAVEPSMKYTASNYFNDNKIMDFRLVSTYGFDENDIAAINTLKGEKIVYPSYFADVLLETEENLSVVHLISLSEENYEKINNFTLTEGRLPENKNECLIDGNVFGINYNIGDRVTFSSGSRDEELSDTLNNDTYTIVGKVNSSLYIDLSSRGSSSIGSGSVGFFVFVPEENFAYEYYNEVYVRFEELSKFNCYSDEFKDRVKELEKKLTEIGDRREAERFSEIMEDAEKEINDAEEELIDAELEFKTEIADAERELIDAEKQLEEAKAQIDEGEKMLETYTAILGETSELIIDGKKQLEDGKKQYEEGLLEYNNGLKEFHEGKLEGEEKIADAKEKLADAKAEISDLKEPEWYYFDRNDNVGYTEYGENAERIHKIAQVFPFFFILVAALVCFTTIQRMVEDQRLQIGTLKALGYSEGAIAFKYLFYSLSATAVGAVVGYLVGAKALPYVVMRAYGMMYSITLGKIPYDFRAMIAAVVVSLIVILATVLFACYEEFNEVPSQLMRPKSPKNGKRVFLERISFLWKRIGFSMKVTIRNIFRYKRRMIMTVLGVSGCTALLLTGFGLYDSIGDIVAKQFDEINTYSGLVILDDDEITDDDMEHIDSVFRDHNSEWFMSHQKQFDIVNGDKIVETTIFTVEDLNSLDGFYNLRERKSGDKITPTGAVITEKAAKLLGADINDRVKVRLSDTVERDVVITAITENYAGHYLYIDSEIYSDIFSEDVSFNMITFKNSNAETENVTLSEELLLNKNILTVQLRGDFVSEFSGMITALNSVIVVIIFFALSLALVVLYNLTNINISERIREIATLKVLGFYDMEVDKFIFREILILSILGNIAGLVLGYFLAHFIITTAEIDSVMFGREIHLLSYIWSSLITVSFSVLVSLMMHFRLIKVDMAQSLKSVE